MVRAVLQNLLGIYVGQCWARDGFFSLATRCYKFNFRTSPFFNPHPSWNVDRMLGNSPRVPSSGIKKINSYNGNKTY